MRTGYQKKTIRLSQIINRDMARYRILFKSSDEVSNPETWKRILSNHAGGRKYEIIVHDNTPDEISENMKKYSILYGLKRLYAAEQMGFDTIPVKVISSSKPIDVHVATCFFNADFVSMSPYERGEFLEDMEARYNQSFDYIARNSGFSFNTLNSIRTAYHDSRRILTLRNAYKDGLISMNLVISMRKYYEITPFSDHKSLTEFIIENKSKAVEKIDRAVKTREMDVTVPQAIRRVISQKEELIPDETAPSLEVILAETLVDDGILTPGNNLLWFVEKMMTNKKTGKQIKAYLTVREKSFAAYTELVSVLPENLILDYKTTLQFPDKSKSSYAFPKGIKKYEKIPKNINERRLLVRIFEYIGTALNDSPFSLQIRTAVNLFNDIRIQNAFAVYFRYSIRYMNLKEKMRLLFQKKF